MLGRLWCNPLSNNGIQLSALRAAADDGTVRQSGIEGEELRVSVERTEEFKTFLCVAC
jgi:hypothetical protein